MSGEAGDEKITLEIYPEEGDSSFITISINEWRALTLAIERSIQTPTHS